MFHVTRRSLFHTHHGSQNREITQKMAPPKDTSPAILASANEADSYEEKNVHEVYQQIAQHFSSTRYKVSLSHLELIDIASYL